MFSSALHASRARSSAAHPGVAALLAFIAVTTCLATPASLAAQQAGDVEGTVVTAGSGAPLSDVMVRVEGTTRGALTDARGSYRIPAVPAGRYALVAQRLGLEPRRDSVTVGAGATTRADFTLAEKAALVAPVVVSATREQQRRADASATIDVLDGAEVRRTRATHPAQIMNRIPGVHVSQLSGEGHVSAIRLPIAYTALYLYAEDGIPLRSTGFFNHNALYEVNIPQSGGVEVLKGPGTALYGSDAIGGVVNVLTRPAPVTSGADVSAEGGAFGYARVLAGGGFTRGLSGVRADVNVARGDNWQRKSPFDRQSGTLRWDYATEGGLAVRTVLAGSNIDQQDVPALTRDEYLARSTVNKAPIATREVKALRVAATIERQQGPSLWSVTPYLRRNDLSLLPYWQLGYDPAIWNERVNSAGLLAKYRRDFAPMRARLIVGADVDYSPGSFTEDAISVTKTGPAFTAYAPRARLYDYDVTYRAISPYVHTELSPATRLRVDAGLRYDVSGYEYENKLTAVDTGSHRRPASTTVDYRHLSPKLGLTYDVSPTLNVFASYRHGFRAPSQGDLFRQGATLNTVGLEPVRANSFEAGVRGGVGSRLLYTVSAYEMRLSNDILTRFESDGAGGFRSVASNAGRTTHRGVEVGISTALTTQLRLDATYTVKRDRFDEWLEFDGKQMDGAPRTLGNALLSYSPTLLNGGRVAVEWSTMGSYFADAGNTHRFGGFQIMNLHANYNVGRNAELFARAVNVANTRYAEIVTYDQFQGEQFTPGTPRAVYAGLRYSVGR
jgi:iron complex outermembrane recepter protein